MSGWAVHTEGLRAAASVFLHAADITEGEITTAAADDIGDPALVAALTAFMNALAGGWMQRVSQTEGVAQTLTASAALYEAADDGGVQDVCRADDF